MLQSPISPCPNPGSVYEVTFRTSTMQAISSAQQLVSVHHPEGTNQRVGQTPPAGFTKISTRHRVPGSLELHLPNRLRFKDFPSSLRGLRSTSTCPRPSHPALPGRGEVTGASLPAGPEGDSIPFFHGNRNILSRHAEESPSPVCTEGCPGSGCSWRRTQLGAVGILA